MFACCLLTLHVACVRAETCIGLVRKGLEKGQWGGDGVDFACVRERVRVCTSDRDKMQREMYER